MKNGMLILALLISSQSLARTLVCRGEYPDGGAAGDYDPFSGIVYTLKVDLDANTLREEKVQWSYNNPDPVSDSSYKVLRTESSPQARRFYFHRSESATSQECFLEVLEAPISVWDRAKKGGVSCGAYLYHDMRCNIL